MIQFNICIVEKLHLKWKWKFCKYWPGKMLPCDSRGVETSLPLWLQSCHFYCYFCHFCYSIVENWVPTTAATITIATQLNTTIQSCRYRPVLSPPTINRLPKSNTSINKVASTWYNSPHHIHVLLFRYICGLSYFIAMIVSMKKLATSLNAFIILSSTISFWLEF